MFDRIPMWAIWPWAFVFGEIFYHCWNSMSLVIVLTVKCVFHFLHSIFKSSEHLYLHYSESSFREITYFLFVYLVLWVSTLCFHLYCISLFFHLFSFFLFLACSTWGLLFPGFRVVLLLPFDFCPWREMLFGWLVLISCWGWCACILVGGDQVGNYRNTGTYTHTLPHIRL